MTENKSTSIFKSLSQRYFLALGILAIIIIVSQSLVQNHLQDQISDSRVINVAGRQRMLSQKLTKETLLLTVNNTETERIAIQKQLSKTVKLWIAAHEGLKNGDVNLALPDENSATVQEMFKNIDPHYQAMVRNTQLILNTLQFSSKIGYEQLQPSIEEILKHEPLFLENMDKLVFQYDEEAKEKVLQLRKIELLLLFVALFAIFLELLFIFRPTARYVQNIIQQLTNANEATELQKQEITELFKEKEHTVQELKALNFALDQASLFASITLDGNVMYISKKLTEFLGYKNRKPRGQFAEILTDDKIEQEYIDRIIRTRHYKIWNGEISITNQNKGKNWLDVSMIPVNRRGVQQDYLILCNDITARKNTELELQRLNEERLTEEIRLQKIRSAQVIEAQEKERKRIARDMHDGIGQMLTALKFNLEAIQLDDHAALPKKIDSLKKLSSNLIKGVRIATFNLTPPELSDYGVATAIAKLCLELSKFIKGNIYFDNKTDFDGRFNSIIETNIYRITQEAVNNAIKYANANFILVTISHSNNLLSIVIYDDGIGFDKDVIFAEKTVKNGIHKGLSFMQERVAYINGRLFIHSKIDDGTRITINVPLDD